MERSANPMPASALALGELQLSLSEVAFFAGVLVLAVAIAWRLASRMAATARASDDAAASVVARIAEAQAALGGRVDALLEAALASQANLQRAVDERMEAVSRRLGEGMSSSERRTVESLRQLHERLAVIDRAQKNIEDLAGEVTGLQALLANKQRRGAFGEIQMQDLVSNFLPPSAIAFQATLSNRARADCLIILPNPPGPVAVDSKFPLDNWRAYAEAADAAAKEAAARLFRADLLTHIKDIADKYLIPGETADTALMFVPSEAVYAAIHAEFSDVVDKSFKRRVMIVSPTTFMATLHTMRAVMRDARMREQAHVIQREVALLADDVGRLDDRVGKLQRHFEQAHEDVRQIRISADKVVARSGRIAEVEVEVEGPADTRALPEPRRVLAAAGE